MNIRKTTLLVATFLLSSTWTIFYIISTFKSRTDLTIDFENPTKPNLLRSSEEENLAIRLNISRTAKVEVIEEVLSCLANSVVPNKTKPSLDVGAELIKETENAKADLTKMEFAYKGLLQELKQKDDVIEFMSQPIINFHEFEYIHNPQNFCSQGGPVRVLFVVPSAPANFDRRSKFRESSLYKHVSDPSNEMKLLFFLGKPPNGKEENNTQRRITEEVSRFKDIVQEDFLDIYRNIRLKAVSMLRWATTFCSNVKFVIRNDDDVTMSHMKLLEVVENTGKQFRNFILGDRKEDWRPHRHNTSKYYLSVDDFSPDTLPPFAVGGLLAYPISTVSLLYQAALRIKPIWLDDIFITGICAPKVGVPLISDPAFTFKHKSEQ